MNPNNPFVLVGYEGPDYFCDRNKETEDVIRVITNDSNITLLSPRRYGKTGLICNAFHHLAQRGEWTTLYLDIFGTQNLADFTRKLANAVFGKLDSPLEKAGGIAKRFIQNLRPTLSYDDSSGKPSLSFEIASGNEKTTLSQIFEYIKNRDRRIVIAIDEFQQINEYPEKGVEATLRSFVQFSPARFIFSGSKQHLMREMFTSPKRPFYQSTFMMPLDVIPEESYWKFASRFFADKGRTIDRKIFHELYSRFDGITWYMQSMLWDFYAADEDISDLRQLDAAVKRRIMAGEYDQQMVLELLPAGARRLLRAIALEGKVKKPQSGDFIVRHGLHAASSVKTSLATLIDKELVYPAPDGYVVYDRFMSEYLRYLAR